MQAAYTAHVTKRDGTVVRIDVEAATSRPQAALMAMLKVGEASRSASARPVHEVPPQKNTDCCSFRALADVADSAFGLLA